LERMCTRDLTATIADQHLILPGDRTIYSLPGNGTHYAALNLSSRLGYSARGLGAYRALPHYFFAVGAVSAETGVPSEFQVSRR
jgi:hypothetical protein